MEEREEGRNRGDEEGEEMREEEREEEEGRGEKERGEKERKKIRVEMIFFCKTTPDSDQIHGMTMDTGPIQNHHGSN